MYTIALNVFAVIGFLIFMWILIMWIVDFCGHIGKIWNLPHTVEHNTSNIDTLAGHVYKPKRRKK